MAAEHPRIEIDPDVMVGKPVIKGTRITVEAILRRFADGYSVSDVLDDYPHLTADDVKAALSYAAAAMARPSKPRAAIADVPPPAANAARSLRTTGEGGAP